MKHARGAIRVSPTHSHRRIRFERPSWLWKWHHLLSVFVFFVGVGIMLASWQYAPTHFPARASVGDTVMGWLWADPIGWTSLNDQNSGACSFGSCGSYGVNIDPLTRNMNGFAWNDVAGWICFGESCSVPACAGVPPAGLLEAHLNPVSGVTELHGWAKVCNEGDAGWISLNCTDAAACGSYAYRVVYDPATKLFTDAIPPPYSSLAWNGTSLSTGFGYIDFSHAYLNTAAENVAAPNACADAVDNDLNGLTDCLDPACQGTPACLQDPSTKDEWGNPTCHNGLNDDGTGVDCASPHCLADPFCIQKPGNFGAIFNPVNPARSSVGLPTCGDGLNNDGQGIDCAAPLCAGFLNPFTGIICGAEPPPGSEASCGLDPLLEQISGVPKTAEQCCTDRIDNDGNGAIDCDDLSCQTAVPQCVPAWLQTKFGNIYATQGVAVSSSPLIAGKNATYCVSSQGTISGFTSESGCTESGAQGLVLPKGDGGAYRSALGKIDLNGIRSGRYGSVVEVAGSISLPSVLAGKVYHILGDAMIGARGSIVIGNGASQTDRGNGLVFVEGGDLTILSNITYAPLGGLQYLRNLASLGVIVTKNGLFGGTIFIKPSVTQVVGALYAEQAISTGTFCPGVTSCPADQQLHVAGMFVAHQIHLERQYRDPNQPAELITFDGRSVANPPPGMADLTKSLPTSKDAY